MSRPFIFSRTTPAAALITLVATFSPSGIAADNPRSDAAPQAATASEAPWVEGVVRKVDKPGGKVTLAHGPLANLGMPAMTMAFRVKDAAWLDHMTDGHKIRFVANRLDGVFTVVRFEPVN